MTERPLPEDALALRAVIEGNRIARAVYVVVKLGVVDRLADGPASAAELATAVDAHEGALFRVLRALANRGIFVERDDGFALTPRGSLLRTGVPGSLRGWTLWHGSEWSVRVWAEFEHSVRTGEPSFEHAFGAPFFEFLSRNPDMAATFGAAMVSISGEMNDAIVDAYDFGRFTSVADLGGGRGALISVLLERYPKMRGVLFDLPPVIASAQELLSAKGVADRVECVSGDFFREVPSGADAYLLKAILHDWQDAEAASILENCRAAMRADATLIVLDMVVPDRQTASPVKEFDLQMLAMQTGRERTEAEFGEVLAAAGFEISEVRPTASAMSVIVATPV